MPRDQLYQRKVPVMLTDAQADWLDDWRFANRFDNRSEAIRALIDREREASPVPTADRASDPLARAEVEREPPTIVPYSVEAYPGQGFAPKIVAFLIRSKRRSYTEDELLTETGLTPSSVQPGQLASIRVTMKHCGFKPTTKKLPGKPRQSLWEHP